MARPPKPPTAEVTVVSKGLRFLPKSELGYTVEVVDFNSDDTVTVFQSYTNTMKEDVINRAKILLVKEVIQ